MKLLLLRRVKPLDSGLAENAEFNRERDEWYWPDWVDNDSPHVDIITNELLEKTLGFAVATPEGEIVKKFKKTDLASAEAARANAKVSLEIDIDLEPEEAETEEETDEEWLESNLGSN